MQRRRPIPPGLGCSIRCRCWGRSSQLAILRQWDSQSASYVFNDPVAPGNDRDKLHNSSWLLGPQALKIVRSIAMCAAI